MKFFVLASALFVIAKAGVIPPVAVPAVTRITAPAFLTAIPLARHSSQYHSQDSIGQYSYGYANDLSAKNEIKSADGQTVGSYSYIDGNGEIQNVQYRADAANGFRVSATNLPIAPSAPEFIPLAQPEPVHDTPEVVEARSRHLEALRVAEEIAKATEVNSLEVKSAIPVEQATKSIAVPTPAAVLKAAPAPAFSFIQPASFIASPAFSYSYSVNDNGLFAVNAYSIGPQPIITSYTTPILNAPIIDGAVPAVSSSTVAEVGKDNAEIVDARAVKVEAAESTKENVVEVEQQQQQEGAKE